MKPETFATLSLALALAACGGEVEAPPPPPAALETAAPAAAAPRATYVGRWAATPELCDDGAWVFEETALNTAGETSCRFEAATSTPTGYLIAALCTAEGPERSHEIVLTLTDPAPPQAMTASGGPWSGAVTLRRCDG